MTKEDMQQERESRALGQLKDWMKSKTLLTVRFGLLHPCIKAQGTSNGKFTYEHQQVRVIRVDSVGVSAFRISLMDDDNPTWQWDVVGFTATVIPYEVTTGGRGGEVTLEFNEGSYIELTDWPCASQGRAA
jgi:hypothetical protein